MVKKKKVQEITPEQRREWDLKEIREHLEFIPEPTYYFEIGDEVRIGNLRDVVVCGIYDNGKIYEIDYTSIDNNYGNPIAHEHQKRFVNWMDIRKISINKESLIQNEDIRLSYFQTSLSGIFSKVYYFGTDFEPDYQREFVWNLEDKVALIDSIFNNIDIGKFVFIHHDYGEKYLYEILDGKQRIKAITDFFEDRFQYKGKYFSDLSYRDQNHIENYPISIAEVRELTKEQILRYFIKLNTCGKVMAKEQIEKVKKMLKEDK